MSVQPSLNNSNMVVAEIINEINSTQPSGNYSQNTRATPIQRRMPVQNTQPQQRQPVQNTQPPQQPQRRATPFRKSAEPHQQPQNPPRNMQKPPVQRKSFLQQQKEKMKNKKVRFKEEVEERVIQEKENESENENESESESEDTTPIENIIEKKEKKDSKKITKPKFLKKDDVQNNDLSETKGFYSRVIHFFTNDTKEPLLVLALVFAISMPVVNKLMTRFLPFIMKYGEGSLFVVGAKALVVALVFFTVKKLLL
jgi:hypothetical protein